MTAYDNITRALLHVGAKVQHLGENRARAQCPIHQSRGLTLSVRRRDDRAVLHCFAGCDDVEILAALDLEVRDLFDEPRKDRPAYIPPKPPPSPWDEAMRGLGLHRYPPFEHLLMRIEQQQQIEQRSGGGAV